MRIWMLLLMLFAFTGCATTRAPSDVGKLQIQMAQLERKMDENTDQLQSMNQRIEQIEENVDSLEPYPVDEPAAIRKSVKPAVVSTPPASTAMTASSTREVDIIRVPVSAEKVQTALKSAGYYNGNVDGKIGNATKAAIRDFQKDHNLNADGVLGKRTWVELQKYLE